MILESNTLIKTIGDSLIIYYSNDIRIDSIINASSSTVEISQQCSSKTSILIGDNDNKYNLNLSSPELLSFYSKNIMFDSYNASIYISGFNQSFSMNGVKDGEMKFIANLPITFDNNDIMFSSLNDNGIKIICYNSIYIYKNIIS